MSTRNIEVQRSLLRSTSEPVHNVSKPWAMAKLYDWEKEDGSSNADSEIAQPEQFREDQDLGRTAMSAVEIIDAKLNDQMTVANNFQHLESDFTRQQN